MKSIFTIIKIQKEAKNLSFGANLTLNNVISDMGTLLVDELQKNPGCNQYIKYIEEFHMVKQNIFGLMEDNTANYISFWNHYTENETPMAKYMVDLSDKIERTDIEIQKGFNNFKENYTKLLY